MKLIIAEKPSMGRAIANALPKPLQNNDGYIVAADGTHVSWCIGHILEQAEPDDYDDKYKKWQYDHLPIIPSDWQLKPKYKTKSQLSTLRRLTKQATQIVHAGDPDREGQLLVDEVIHFLKIPKQKQNTIQRLLVSDLNMPAIKKALGQLKSNQEYMPLSVSALARARSDWLIGMNLTRAFTLLGQKSNFNAVLSVGRVQTPLLGIVVRRDLEIESFISKEFYQVDAHLITQGTTDVPTSFTARWQPSDHCAPHQDDQGRVINKKLAQHVVNQITQQKGVVVDVLKKRKKQIAPLPYNLSTLQIDAAKAFKLSAQQVLDACQALYERHKLITYPRSDCRYLPKQHLTDVPKITQHLAQPNSQLPELQAIAESANTQLKSRAWNDAKVGAHHAIIPTLKSASKISLSNSESNVYKLIAKQYLAQFFDAHEIDETEILIDINNGRFKTKRNQIAVLGWKIIYGDKKTPSRASYDDEHSVLPPLQKGDALFCEKGELLIKQTEPPAHYTDATLLAAMTGIARYVKDPDIKKVLRETDGLGTEATRAGMIELLFKRNYLCRTGKSIIATDIGKALIKSLPEEITLPDMTAQWEMQLQQICEQNIAYTQFISDIEARLIKLIDDARNTTLEGLPSQPFKPKRKFNKGGAGKRSNGASAKRKYTKSAKKK